MGKLPQKNDDHSKPNEPLDLVDAIRGELVDSVPRNKVDGLSERISQMVVSEYHSGPLPHPRHLAQYNQLIPNGADRVMKMAESALAHSQSVQEKLVDSEVRDRDTGMWMGFACFVLLILAALIVFLVTQSEVGAGLFLAAAAVNVIGLFVKGRGKSD